MKYEMTIGFVVLPFIFLALGVIFWSLATRGDKI